MNQARTVRRTFGRKMRRGGSLGTAAPRALSQRGHAPHSLTLPVDDHYGFWSTRKVLLLATGKYGSHLAPLSSLVRA